MVVDGLGKPWVGVVLGFGVLGYLWADEAERERASEMVWGFESFLVEGRGLGVRGMGKKKTDAKRGRKKRGDTWEPVQLNRFRRTGRSGSAGPVWFFIDFWPGSSTSDNSSIFLTFSAI